jgi:hypothetical protein
MNTPRGGGPRTPRTPTVSTSFFFSDVAGLPRSGELSPKQGGEGGKRGGSQRGYSNIICISPLASSKAKNGASKEANTPTINYKDMFASPAERNRGLSLMDKLPKGLQARTARGSATKDPSIDAVHMAERDLMEDEDLSVLLQLASNTPRSTGEHPVAVSTSDGTHVFRSPNGRTSGAEGDESLPSLQLPVIGGRDSESNGTRLTRKTHSRDHGEAPDDLHRPLGIRSNGQVGSKDGHRPKSNEEKGAGDRRKDKANGEVPKKSNKNMHPGPPPYSMPLHHYPHPDAPYYPAMPPGMAPHGSMRVIVGGPPPSRGAGSSGSPHASPHAPRPYPMGPGDPNYPPPPYPPPPGHYAHHPGVPPPHMHPHYSHYPPPHHPPRPPHMPMYGAQHPPSKSKTTKKAPKPSKQGTKRPAHTPVPTATKKQKKSSPASATKKKTKSPQITDKADRQKAAAAIQAVNAASGGKNDKAAALAAAILRGVTMRPSGKWVSYSTFVCIFPFQVLLTAALFAGKISKRNFTSLGNLDILGFLIREKKPLLRMKLRERS